jgi:DegV family protein with EDD domain
VRGGYRIRYGARMSASTPRVAVVTDSTAALPAALTGGLTVVPLTVVIDGKEGREGVDTAPAEVATALMSHLPVSTSRPAPWMFVAEYERLLGMGYDGVLSIHLSARLSGTFDSATLAAADFDGRVEVMDSRAAGMGLGFPAVAAAAAAAGGADLAGVRAAAGSAIERTTTLFYVDTLEFMRRGGRIGTASAALGTALAVKPILGMSDGTVVPLEKVRTGSRAIARVAERAVDAAAGSTVDIAVQHAAAPERAAAMVEALTARLTVRECHVGEVGAVLAAHSGPGLVCTVLHRVLAD